jgi:hypothetical protein
VGDPGSRRRDRRLRDGYSNPAMARMIGVATEASIGRRLLQEAPDFGEDETFTRMRSVLESGRPEVVEVAADPAKGRSAACAASSCTARSRSGPMAYSTS